MSKGMVLLVDDDIDFCTANRTALEAAGYSVAVAHNGVEGLKIARENRIAVAILDVMMDSPDEGFALARDLRKEPATKGIPLVMLTSVNEVNRQAGYTFEFSDKDRDEVWLPIDRFLNKPVKPSQLLEAVRSFVKETGE
jgi:CheY-like chemotaxis protein